MDEKRQEYLSDAELDELICQVEEREMLQAPSYLKGEILFHIRELPAVSLEGHAEKLPKGCTEERTERKSEQKEVLSPERRKKILFFYSLKVSMAAAAAIVLLFAFPVRERTGVAGDYWMTEEEYLPPSSRVMRSLNEHSTQFCRKLSYVSNWLVSNN